MRIFVDGRHLGAGRGVGRYTRELLPRMRELGGNWEVVSAGRAHNASAALLGRPRLGVGSDVTWIPAPAPVAPCSPYVLTVHDLSWEVSPADFTLYERLWHRLGRLRRLAERASLMIAVSEATKAELVARWGIDEGRIRVVRSGPGLLRDQAPVHGEPRSSRRYFLVVGALEPRKDPETAARAFAIARTRGLDAELWFAGEGRLADAVRGEGVRVLGRQDDAQLHELYANAIALVHPALIEGFAFPPVEAAAYGTPAIVADIAVHAETLGDAALRFAPGDASALAEAMLNVPADLGERARAAIAHLSWERAAEQTYAVLEEAAGC